MFRRTRAAWRLGLPIAAAVAVMIADAGARTAAQDPPLPTGRDLAARHVAALGGVAAFEAVSSYRATGTLEIAGQGISGTVEMFAARPDRLLVKLVVPGLGTVRTGYDGRTAWIVDPVTGPAVLSGAELSQAADEAWFDAALHGPDYVREMTTDARTEFDRRAAYRVRVVLRSGRELTEYFDVETGLQIGIEGPRETPLGRVPTVSYLRGYQRFGDLLHPTELVQMTLGIEQRIRLTTFEYDAVPASTFDLPAEIKALIK